MRTSTSRSRRLLAVLVLALSVGLVSPPAWGAAARQFTVGVGQHPTVAVVTSGGSTTVHVAWATTSGFPESEGVLNAIGYCRLPPRARVCQERQVLLPLGRFGEGAAPELWTTDDGALVITDGRGPEAADSGLWMLISHDGGTSWIPSNISRVSRGNSGLLSRARHLEVLDPADGSLARVGSGYFSFGLPVSFVMLPRTAVAPPPELAESPPDFARDGTRRVYSELLGRLPDGRLFAAGHDPDESGETVYARTTVPGGDPNDPATGWTPWRALSLSATLWGVGYAPGRGPTALLTGYTGGFDGIRVVPFDGRRVGRGPLIGGDLGTAGNYISTDLAADGSGALHATWLSFEEGCRRDTRCLLYTRLDSRLRPGPKDVVRFVPDTETQPVLEFATVASSAAGDAWVAWQERTPAQDALPKVRLAQMCRTRPTTDARACQEHQANLGRGRLATLTAPNLVTTRRFRAGVTADARIRSVRFTLRPPFCRPPSSGDGCYALRRPVTVTRARAPFRATFAGLPEARNIGTTNPLKNRRCGADAYLYDLVARVTTAAGSATLRRDVSVCPIVR